MAGLNTRKKTRLMMTMMTIDYVDHGDHDYDHVYDHLGNDDDQLKGSNFFANFSRAEKLRCYFGIPAWYQSDREVLSENRQTLSCQVLTAQKLQLPVYLAFLASPEALVIIVVKYTQADHFVKFGAMLSIYILIYYIYLLTCNKGKSL